ncbi:TPA: hypothetical protein G9F27_004659 [Salmonella enterica]|uniref:Uncharacterized protein n=1 Tax=Salmonella enterica TaxID=28901 RepID=A0A743P9J2_SALER|nr:hypothetical protein [Salmonella enterica]
MAKAKFFVFENLNDNKYRWELRWKKNKITSESFENQPAAIEDLESIIPIAGKAPMYDSDGILITENESRTPDTLENSPIYFIFLSHNNGLWDWWCLKKGGGLFCKGSEEKTVVSGFSSFEDALESARNLRSIIEHAEIVDVNGVMIPDMLFSPEFAEKYGIGDMHPSHEFIKKNKL